MGVEFGFVTEPLLLVFILEQGLTIRDVFMNLTSLISRRDPDRDGSSLSGLVRQSSFSHFISTIRSVLTKTLPLLSTAENL